MNQDAHQPLTRRETFALWVSENVRYVDMDTQGHANNAVYATYFEIGRGPLFHTVLRQRPPGAGVVVAQLHIVYRRPVVYPARIDIGSVVLRLGRSSFDLGLAVFVGDTCMATGVSTHVLVDADGHAQPLTATLREGLTQHLRRAD